MNNLVIDLIINLVACFVIATLHYINKKCYKDMNYTPVNISLLILTFFLIARLHIVMVLIIAAATSLYIVYRNVFVEEDNSPVSIYSIHVLLNMTTLVALLHYSMTH